MLTSSLCLALLLPWSTTCWFDGVGIFNMSLKDGNGHEALDTLWPDLRKNKRNKLGLGYKRSNKLNKRKTREFTPLIVGIL
jgi:hypothetical protein